MGKAIGCILILSGCIGLGVSKSRKLKKRVNSLKQLQRILLLFETQINFEGAPLWECVEKIAAKAESPYKECLEKIFKESLQQRSMSFEMVFKKHFDQISDELCLLKEDIAQFYEFLQTGSFLDKEVQKKIMENSREELLKKTLFLEQENKEKCKVSITFGAMAGFMLTVLLL